MIQNIKTENPTYPELDIMVNPDDDFDEMCVNVHHITRSMVLNAKKFDEVWKEINKYFTNSIVVGHNVANSDLDALCKNLIRYNIPLPKLYYLDTYEIAKDLIQPYEIKNYTLETLCTFFDIEICNKHNAFDDACACSDLLSALKYNRY